MFIIIIVLPTTTTIVLPITTAIVLGTATTVTLHSSSIRIISNLITLPHSSAFAPSAHHQ